MRSMRTGTAVSFALASIERLTEQNTFSSLRQAAVLQTLLLDVAMVSPTEYAIGEDMYQRHSEKQRERLEREKFLKDTQLDQID
jgi:hypothetical protein